MASEANGRAVAVLGAPDPVARPGGHHGRTRRRPDPAPWLVGAAVLGLRLATAARGPTDWDSAQYAAATRQFDVTHGQPQPPGYWLYVESGRWVARLTGAGTVTSLVLVAALASAVACGLVVVAGRDLAGRWTGVAAGAVVATSPFAWFSGSIVATYSFDLLASVLLVVLAWRARPGSLHGVAAVGALGVVAGFRPSTVEAFALLALIPVAVSTRTWRLAALTAGTGAAAVALWAVPMALQQPGGLGAWLRATRIEAAGAAGATSILDGAPGGHVNLGTFAATTVVALLPVALLAAGAGIVLAARRAGGRLPADPDFPDAVPSDRSRLQSRTVILVAAIVPPAALVALVQFAKGGYLLAYLPAAVIALLLPVAALHRPGRPTRGGRHRAARSGAPWLVLSTVGVVAVAALGAQRYLGGAGVLPARWLRAEGGVWLQQARYQAPYPDTASAVRAADAADAGLAALGPKVGPAKDVIVFDTLDGGANLYRNAGWELPDRRVALVAPGGVLYQERGGALYYSSGDSVAVGTGGSAFLVASPSLPGLAALTRSGLARPVALSRPIGGYLVWRIPPGATVLGVHVVQQAGPRPLGQGI